MTSSSHDGTAFVADRRAATKSPAEGPSLEFFLISLLNGVSYGLLLFMLSSGLTLIFSMMGVLNFAHAAFYMLGRVHRVPDQRSGSASGRRW